MLAVLLFLLTLSTPLEANEKASTLLVSIPATDLRRNPILAKENDFGYDPLQETQLLYGEKVLVLEQKNGWSRVEAFEQLEWSHHQRWEGYPGWIRSGHLVPIPPFGWEPNAVVISPTAEVHMEPNNESAILLNLFIGTKIAIGDLSEGTKWQSILLIDGRSGWVRENQIASLDSLRQLPLSQLRQQIITTARTFLGKPYFWGGLSQAVDCSGLAHLSYRANGIDLPRDAHEQFMKSQPIDHSQLEPADLIFFGSEENPNRISHVMLYAGNGKVIEGPGTGKFVEEKPLDEKLNQNQDRKVYFASVLK